MLSRAPQIFKHKFYREFGRKSFKLFLNIPKYPITFVNGKRRRFHYTSATIVIYKHIWKKSNYFVLDFLLNYFYCHKVTKVLIISDFRTSIGLNNNLLSLLCFRLFLKTKAILTQTTSISLLEVILGNSFSLLHQKAPLVSENVKQLRYV